MVSRIYKLCLLFVFLLLVGCPDSKGDFSPDVSMNSSGDVIVDLSRILKASEAKKISAENIYLESIFVSELVDFSSNKYSPVWQLRFPIGSRISFPISFKVGDTFPGASLNVVYKNIEIGKVYYFHGSGRVGNDLGQVFPFFIRGNICIKASGEKAIEAGSKSDRC
ncbi:hypothetical protein [Chromobacterium amazonense]|uniref:hypothetical protein n=1 Tax=Chromobacterium amazonense TaxID=1382803 RepID=UPI003F798D95